ncbi:MAG: GNAT family N-acetyltransferase [Haliea sp.]|mgnify:CR=1 FL=1|jgi:[ribosomal protein S5]-alanine N-acetyltransferase|nr:GNAT family N-acetyltransferase [Haliea sp.]MDP5063166.1 GNAT family N-acetyltransferase [Haliea sp.]
MLHTPRLLIDPLTEDDAAFMLALLNDPDFILHIADRGVRSIEQAKQYLRDGPLASYRENGFGLWAVRPVGGGEPLGICGLVKRAGLSDVDIGYGFLPAARGRGLAHEAAVAVLGYAAGELSLRRLVAIVAPANTPSRTLLEHLDFRHESMVRLTPEAEELCLYAWESAQNR